MEAITILVKEGDVASITCPFCRKTKKISVAQYKGKTKRQLCIKCSCKNIFSICLEFRKYPRKSVKLLGKSINLSQHRERQDILILNISLGGIGFCPFNMKHRTREDHRLQVFFDLTDCNNTALETETTVRAAAKDYVGCEFKTIENFRPSLGFYLLS